MDSINLSFIGLAQVPMIKNCDFSGYTIGSRNSTMTVSSRPNRPKMTGHCDDLRVWSDGGFHHKMFRVAPESGGFMDRTGVEGTEPVVGFPNNPFWTPERVMLSQTRPRFPVSR